MDAPRFLVDSMLGRLARWLRTLGYDAAYECDGSRGDLPMVEQARREGRILVTRDRAIPAPSGVRMIVLRAESPEDQLRETLHALGEKPRRELWFSRCPVCNGPLGKIPRDEGLAEAPERVRGLETDFFRCGTCGKLYWMGTHTADTLRRLSALGY